MSRRRAAARRDFPGIAMSAALTPAALDALRAATPGTRTTVHFNHAGASLPSTATLDAIQAHLRRERCV